MASDPSSLHQGHRQRMRERYAQTGLTGFQPHEILEMVLYCSIPKKDVNPLAHTLINHFGSLDGVLSASREELLSISGVGERTCDLIQTLSAACRFYEENRFADRERIGTIEAAVRHVTPLFTGGAGREMAVLFEDGSGCVLSAQRFAWNTADPASIREVLSLALQLNTHSVILVCRRPGSARKPMQAELNAISQLIFALCQSEIYVIDYLILTGNKVLSLRTEGILRNETTSLRDSWPAAQRLLEPPDPACYRDGWFELDSFG